ncbi:hypothetical protein ACEQ8H_008920 [Pleosporales sp. CAS-2024a]
MAGPGSDVISTTTHTAMDSLDAVSMDPWMMPFTWNDTHGATESSHLGAMGMNATSATLVSYPANALPRSYPGSLSSLQRPLTSEDHSNHGFMHSGLDSMQRGLQDSKHRLRKSESDATSSVKMPVTVGQLAQLTMRLSSLRHKSSNLVGTAGASSGGGTERSRSSLVDDAAFESVVAWLARDELAGGNAEHIAAEAIATTASSSTQGILHETFSASHVLLEILGKLEDEQADRHTDMMLGAMLTPSPTAGHGYFDIAPNLNAGVLSTTDGDGMTAQARSHTSIRHLVMVCNTLMLEVYLLILVALQHDAYLGVHANKIMKSVRMVLLVQLCSHLVDRQCQALQVYQNSVHLALGPDERYLDADRNVLEDLKRQVQDRLHQLRQMLKCVT